MQSALATLRVHLDVLCQAAAPAPGRKPRGKQERLKAVVAISNALARKATINGLTAASKLEMVRGPQQDPTGSVPPLGWAELTAVMVETMNQVCMEALKSKSTSRSRAATLKPDYMSCFRVTLKLALSHGPTGVIRPIVPALLYFAHSWLSEPTLRVIIADQIWQCIRDVLQDDENRAVLTPPFIRTWVDVCVEQLTGRGPLRHCSSITWKLAAEVLEIIARSVPNYDTLTQSTKSTAPSKMSGGDFGYAIICERCCLMLVMAKSMQREEARALQSAAFRTLSVALSDHYIDVVGSNALQSIVNVSLKPLLLCWTDRRHHESAVAMARVLTALAPAHRKLLDTLRQRILTDLQDDSSLVVLRGCRDNDDDFIQAAAACFSLRECLEFACLPSFGQAQAVIWMRVAHSIITCRVVKKGTSLLPDAMDLFEQCTKAAETVNVIFAAPDKIREKHFREVVRGCAGVVEAAAYLADRIYRRAKHSTPFALEAWQKLYTTLREHMLRLHHSVRTKLSSYTADGQSLSSCHRLLCTLSFLCTLSIVENATLDCLSRQTMLQTGAPYPFSSIMSTDGVPTALEVEYARNLIARVGLAYGDGGHFRFRLIYSLIDMCAMPASERLSCPRMLIDGSSAALGLARGECSLSSSVKCPLYRPRKTFQIPAYNPLNPVLFFRSYFGQSVNEGEIVDDGSRLVGKIRDQDVWARDECSLDDLDRTYASQRTSRRLGSAKWDESGWLLSSQQYSGNGKPKSQFALDPEIANSIENQIVLKLSSLASNVLTFDGGIDRDLPEQIGAPLRNQPKGHGEYKGYGDEDSANVGSKLLLFLGHYVLLGISTGVVTTASSDGVTEEPALDSMGELLGQLSQKFGATKAEILLRCDGVTREVVRTLTKLCHVLSIKTKASSSADADGEAVWSVVHRTVSTCMVTVCCNICRHMCNLLTSSLRENIVKVEHYSAGGLIDPETDEVPNLKRSKVGGRLTSPTWKRQRVHTSSSSNSSLENIREHGAGQAFGDEDKDADSDSSLSDFGDFAQQKSKISTERIGVCGGGRMDACAEVTAAVRACSELLEDCLRNFPSAGDQVFEVCRSGTETIKDMESLFSPDGFERAALASELVNAYYTDQQVALWRVLFAQSSTAAIHAVGKEIFTFGARWRELERVSNEYASFYIESLEITANSRKHYPMLISLERDRIIFLDQAKRYFDSCIGSDVQCGTGSVIAPIDLRRSSPTYLVGSLVNIGEHFRIQHAFRMPRETRIAYLRFALTAVELIQHKTTNLISVSEGDANQTSFLRGACEKMQSAICKSMADSEAVVRVIAASSLPRFLKTFCDRPAAQIERLVQDSIPQRSVCEDSKIYYGCKTLAPDEEEVSQALFEGQFELSDEEQLNYGAIRLSFRNIGARAKTHTSYVALGEVALAREDLLPFCMIQLCERVLVCPESISSAYHTIARLCAALRCSSPRSLYLTFARLIIPKWFAAPQALHKLYNFPASLVVDVDHHRAGVLHDWMRDQQGLLLPHILVRDEPPSLLEAKKFGRSLGEDLQTLLTSNIGPVSLVFPMQFTGRYHERGREIWEAVDSHLFRKSKNFLFERKADVVRCFLFSASSGMHGRRSTGFREDSPGMKPGFYRDSRDIRPPFYDPLIVALAINQLFESDSNLLIPIPRNVLQGSLFAEVRDEKSGTSIAEDFSGFVKECQRGTVPLLRVLLTMKRFLCGPPDPQPIQNRVDGFFCVGMLWRMLGVNVLVKSSNERVLFYKLVTSGFEMQETVADAVWLLSDVQRRVSAMYEDYPDVIVNTADLCADASSRDYLLCLATTRERQMFELLSVVSPILVSIAVNEREYYSAAFLQGPSQGAASNALFSLLKLCYQEGLWTVVLSNGPYPAMKEFAASNKLYESSKEMEESSWSPSSADKVIASLNRFQGIYRLRKCSRSMAAMIACLQELRIMLTDSVLKDLSIRMKQEAWVRSDGQEEATFPHIRRAIASLINLVYDASNTFTNRLTSAAFRWSTVNGYMVHSSEVLKDAMFDEAGNVLGVLGLLHPQSNGFIHSDTHHRSIPGFGENGQYEYVESGIKVSLLLLNDMLRSSSSIQAEAALASLVEVLRSVDGKQLFSREKLKLNFVAPFRTAARKLDVRSLPPTDLLKRNLKTGEEVLTNSFPSLSDPQLWSMDVGLKNEDPDYKLWLRTLCSVLAQNCDSSALRTLETACYVSYELSCELLPYLLMDVARNPSAEIVSDISLFIRQHVLGPHSNPAHVTRTFVHALDVLCQVGLTVMRRENVDSRFDSHDGRVRLRRLFILDIPYTEVARASIRSGLYFSAVRYSQLHIDEKVIEKEREVGEKGATSRSDRRHSSYPPRDVSVELAEQVARDDVRGMVKEAMTHLNEPDGVRAFGNDEHLPKSAADLACLDKDWARSLSSLDIVSRLANENCSGHHTLRSAPCNETEESVDVDVRKEIDVLKSFIGLGTLSIAVDYWDGFRNRVSRVTGQEQAWLANSEALLTSDLNDLRYAVAWKLGHWEAPALLPARSASVGKTSLAQGFHETVHRALGACRSGRIESVQRILSHARIAELRGLVQNSSGVSAKSVFQTSARLCVFRILEETFGQYASKTLDASCSYSRQLSSTSCSSEQRHFLETGMMGNLSNVPPFDIVRNMSDGFFGAEEADEERGVVVPYRDAFDESLFAEDLPVAIVRCAGIQSHVTCAATTVSARLLAAGGSGSWARATACLGSFTSVCASEATRVDCIAWKLQEARLRWAASHDAVSKKQALSKVKEIICKSLGGQDSEKGGSASEKGSTTDLAFRWSSEKHAIEKYALLRSEACRMAAEWSLDLRTHEPINLFETFLESGLRAVQSSASTKQFCGRAHLAMATFADAQLTNIDAYRKTRKYDEMVLAIQERELKIERLKTMKKGQGPKSKGFTRRSSRSSRSDLASGAVTTKQIDEDLQSLIATEQKKAAQERARLQKLHVNYQRWQILACKHFAACLREGSTHDLRAAFRMIALWLDSGPMREAITRALLPGEEKRSDLYCIDVPVSKLLPLSPQLSSRLTSPGFAGHEVFQKSLADTIQQMARQFPAHCMWQLLALSNATRVSANKEKYSSLYRGDQDKKDAADDVLNKLQTVHGQTLLEMKRLAEGYIRLSEVNDTEKKRPRLSMKGMEIMQLGELGRVPIPTVALPLSGCDYCPDLPYVAGFESEATVCSGLSSPLKIVCCGSDGRKYPQMVKGKDDLRGDAVMEQMFTILNSLLHRDREASRRDLLVRTYRIIPLSPFSGIMQFVDNTSQLKDVLVDKGKQGGPKVNTRSLHERYRPQDMRHEVISAKVFEFRRKQDLQKRLQVLARLWQKIQPVFRFFFLEQWPDPAEWFCHQLAYSRSVAVMSIVGFILGLGDRHLSNILVDVGTGEVVHIDFGIAFEQGKLLPTPEHMPFRLTRDVVDGFGIAGVEGVFRRCSEVTLAVMRNNKDVLITVVEVLLHDPMFNWALTPEDVLREQPGDGVDDSVLESDDLSGFVNESAIARKISKDVSGSREARRALDRISEKLDGLEGTERLSVEAHVARLVDEARAFHVVASVYPGWAPWI